MDRGNEEKAAQIVDLEEELQAMTEDRDLKEDERDDEKQRADELLKEKTDFEASVARLSESLQQYRTEEDKLTATVTRMEEEHRNTVAAMNKERAGDLIYWALVFGMWCDFVPTDGLRDDIERYLRSHRPQ